MILLLLDNEDEVSSSYSPTSSNRSRSSSGSAGLPLPFGIAIGCDEDNGRNDGLVGDNIEDDELVTASGDGDEVFSEDIPGAAL